MLRHKRIIYLPLFHYKKPVMFTEEKSFHVSHSAFIRKIASLRKKAPELSSAIQESSVAGNFVAQPLKSTFNNFYGIESDEGVILINEEQTTPKSSQDSFINKYISKQLPEKFKKTSFGKVRLDTENKLILHGQYEENTSISEVDVAPRAMGLRKIAIEDFDSNVTPPIEEIEVSSDESQLASNHLNDIKDDAVVQLEKSITDANEVQNREMKNTSFIDEVYFPDKLLKNQENDNVIFENNTSVNLKEDISYIDKCYFSNEQGKGSLNTVLNLPNEDCHFEVNNKSVVDEKSALSEEKPGHIDESFYNSKLKKLSAERNLKLIYERDFNSILKNDKQTKNMSLDINDEQMSFMDECFFKDDLASKNDEKNIKFSIEHVGVSETSISHDNVVKETRSHQLKKKKETVYKSKTELNVKNDDKILNYRMYTKRLDDKSIEQETLNYNSSELNNDHKDRSTRVVAPLKNNNFIYKEAVKKSLNSIINPKDISDFSSIKDSQPETAFDFVKNLRGEKKVTYHESISGFSSMPKEKLDSKGFRILKYQVPELKYYTRDEILELLIKNVLYSDDDVVVLNKPYNLVMHDSKTTKDACLSHYLDDFAGLLDKNNKNPKLLTVHRLDKETTGCLLLARNEISAQRLKSLFAQRKIVKTYWIVTIRVPDPLQGIIDIPITEGFIDKKARMVLHPDLPKDIAYRNHSKLGKNAVTHYNVIAESGNAALVEVKPETGIKHQIRVHFGFGLACPILGDHKYSYPDKFVPQKLSSDMLHRLQVQQSKVRHIPLHIYSRSIFIPQYTVGRNLFVMAPMPIHMSKNLQRLKFKKN